MLLSSIKYSEFENTPRSWDLAETRFGQINLIVGRNASGKTRLINVIAGLSKLLVGADIFSSGTYVANFSDGKEAVTYELSMLDGQVTGERLIRGSRVLLNRGRDGIGTIWAEQLNQDVPFQSPPSSLAAAAKVDKIQHPFLQELLDWAQRTRHFQFGTPLGRDKVMSHPVDMGELMKKDEFVDTDRVAHLYIKAFGEFREEFDKAILGDLEAMGYPCTDVGVEDADRKIFKLVPPFLSIYVKEKDLQGTTQQLVMSQGMFRALSLVIQLNYVLFRKLQRTILIDDIGEGLDYSRAQSFIALLIEKAKRNGLQLIMTTNDRFIMNGVSLDYWSVIKRVAGHVSVFSKSNSPKVFEEFETLGLSNFDFFSSNFFEDGLVEK